MRLLITLFCFSLFTSAFAFDTDRPGQSINPTVISKDSIQLQSGLTASESGDKDKVYHNNNAARYGLGGNLELNSGLDVVHENDETDLVSAAVGARYHLLDMDKIDLGVQALFNAGNLQGDENVYSAKGTIAASYAVSKDGSVVVNYSVLKVEDVDDLKEGFTLAYNHTCTEKISGFVELYGVKDAETDLYANLGGSFLLNANLQLDASVGMDLETELDEKFASAGVSLNF